MKVLQSLTKILHQRVLLRISRLIFTYSHSVNKVCLNYETSKEQTLSKLTMKQAQQYLKEGHFRRKHGSKIEGAIEFLKQGGKSNHYFSSSKESIKRERRDDYYKMRLAICLAIIDKHKVLLVKRKKPGYYLASKPNLEKQILSVYAEK